MTTTCWLIDCHVHTNAYSQCSNLRPKTACELALKRGLDALVFTEHHIQWPYRKLLELRHYFPGLAIFSGLEVSLAEGFDVIYLLPELDLEIAPGQSITKVDRYLRSLSTQTFSFFAHPFRFLDAWDPSLEPIATRVQGLEMNSVNILRRQFCLRGGRYRPSKQGLYRKLQGPKLLGLYNTDAHQAEAIGSIATELNFNGPRPTDTAELASILLQRPRTQEFQDPRRLLHLLEPRVL